MLLLVSFSPWGCLQISRFFSYPPTPLNWSQKSWECQLPYTVSGSLHIPSLGSLQIPSQRTEDCHFEFRLRDRVLVLPSPSTTCGTWPTALKHQSPVLASRSTSPSFSRCTFSSFPCCLGGRLDMVSTTAVSNNEVNMRRTTPVEGK